MQSPRHAAIEIWKAGLAAVDSKLLVQHAIHVEGGVLSICGEAIPLAEISRIVVVGGGKASAGMAAGVEESLPPQLLERTTGWVNVPADCVRPLARIRLHAARPAGVNEPTEDGAAGVAEILKLVRSLDESSLCLVLISGGASALLPGPPPGISLADKLKVTQLLMRSGASIEELNAVRSRLSHIKGGGLAYEATGGRMRSLIISDVIGDPINVIASGPTSIPENHRSQSLDPREVLLNRIADRDQVPLSIWSELSKPCRQPGPLRASVVNQIIGNNQVAVRAAHLHAEKLGFDVIDLGSDMRGEAIDVGIDLATRSRQFEAPAARANLSAANRRPVCIISGGEPTVTLTSCDQPGKGGRNQELALAALASRWNENLSQFCLVSAGTDGEDGPTDAAGGIADQETRDTALSLGLTPQQFLAKHDSYSFLEKCNGLLKTGPTHTNVMDLRVAVTLPRPAERS